MELSNSHGWYTLRKLPHRVQVFDFSMIRVSLFDTKRNGLYNNANAVSSFTGRVGVLGHQPVRTVPLKCTPAMNLRPTPNVETAGDLTAPTTAAV